MPISHPDAVGTAYDPALMRRARERSWAVLADIRARLRPGISETQAQVIAAETFHAHAVERLWHKPYIRFGEHTLKTYRERPEADLRLADDDIFFIDLGLVFDGHEGDVGDTFTVGDAPERQACADAARRLFHDVAAAWREQGISGRELYAFADEHAQAMGWQFNHAVKGHRVGDFPHAIHKAGNLGDLPGAPTPGLWVLEIQIAHPDEPFGAFYEDVLEA